MQLSLTTMAFLALFTVVLLVYCTGVCTSQESDLVVLTTASRLREEIKSQLDETELCTCQPQNCSSFCGELITEMDKRVNRTVEHHISQLFFNLSTPGYTPSHPATSCKEILQLAHSLPQVSTGSGELTMQPNTCTVTWRGSVRT